ncbi:MULTISPECIES: hypothetical protein [unclassified Mesorhizobium]|uniref:hypothetical protein n=1 Tax=unclassified Mesorhizobium TaxID=325217 RepID=UPI00112EA2B0|nr:MULTISPECIES: hypothetical protein [unclassified Mesorhizobium]TPJ70497.1 hypothetical protein FJ462_07330 [Mesorhizobium sp. B2-6-7]TPJ76846.1 hypothetical protein FJ422_29490 [Mesorhizobium sp. B2-6-3]
MNATTSEKLERMLTNWEKPEREGVMLPGTQMTCDTAAAAIRAALSASPVGQIAEGETVEKPFGLDKDQVETLRANGLKPEEISGDPTTQARRVGELLHWFDRLSRGSANPKWTREHAFELAYYIATTDDRAPIDTHELEKAAWLKGVKATHVERDQMLRFGFITKAEFAAALSAAPLPSAPGAEP